MIDFFCFLAANASNSFNFFSSSSLAWAILTLVAILVEIGTASIVSLWFIPGTIVALILSLIPGMPLFVEIFAFAFLSVGCFLLFRKKFKEKVGADKIATNADAVIGKTAIVTEEIDNIHSKGAVKVQGKEWSARSEDQNTIIQENELVTVIRIEGVKLICKKYNN